MRRFAIVWLACALAIIGAFHGLLVFAGVSERTPRELSALVAYFLIGWLMRSITPRRRSQ